MKTKIWKKICDRVRIIDDGRGYFIVQAREKLPFKRGFTEWHDLNSYGAYKHAVKKKHSFVVMILMRELGYRYEFIAKRTKRKREKGII